MADAQLAEEELQQSVMVSEGDAEYETQTTNNRINTGALDEDGGDVASDRDGETGDDEVYASVEEDENRHSENDSQDDEEEDGEGDGDVSEDGAEGGDDGESDRHASAIRSTRATIEDQDVIDDEEEEDEGVGAVKIRPGETDDEEGDEGEEGSEASASLHSSSSSDEESDDVAEWDLPVEGRGGDGDEDEESEAANANICMFCKQDEDHDPAEEFEPYLACSLCGENSHQQCAREANALRGQQDAGPWKCPHCGGEAPEEASDTNEADADATVDADMPSSSRRSSAPKFARDLLPSQKGANKPDSHSVFNQLVLDEDPMDGSRVLRKRKTSSAEAEEIIMSLRKRRSRHTADEHIAGEGASGSDGGARPHSARSLRLKVPQQPPATILKKTRTSLVIKIRANTPKLREILSNKSRGDRKRASRGGARGSRPGTARSAGTAAAASLPALPPFAAPSFSQPFYSFYDKETDELKGKPYGGILNDAEADTSKTLPTTDDRRRFDEAKQKAEEEWRQRLLAMQAEIQVPAKKSKKTSGPASQIECIEFGGWEIDTWYAAPYPEEYSRNRVLYICEFCLKYMNSDYVAWRHKLKCPAKHPPGDEIYRHESVSVFEVDGRRNPVYCQNLCLLAKLFLGSKTLYYDVEPFLFYVLCEYDDLGYHFVGYFSKEKRASSQNNVSCILTLPIHQRKGYGNLLIDFSYLLTRVEEKTGSPEKPLSDMGLVSYRNYWRLVMCRYLLGHVPEDKSQKRGLSIKQISDDTGFTADDVVSALEGLRCLVRDPQTRLYAFRVDLDYCRAYVAKWESKKYVQLKPSALTWTPYVMGRSNAANFELGPALNAIAPREEEGGPKPVAADVEVITNGDSRVAQPTTNGVDRDHDEKPEITPPVLESTEPDETGPGTDGHPSEDSKPNGVAVNGVGSAVGSRLGSTATGADPEQDWTAPYTGIPPTRFEVFPPVSGTRRLDRSRSTVGRPPGLRTAGPRARRSVGGRRSTSSVPKSAVKRSGGTGRGPGRWPKGTKKSDYGNAASGPGLPPAWIEERRRAALAATQNPDPKKEDGEDAMDTVEVQTPEAKETKCGPERKRGASNDGSGSRERSSRRSSREKARHVDGDVEMEDADDVDK